MATPTKMLQRKIEIPLEIQVHIHIALVTEVHIHITF